MFSKINKIILQYRWKNRIKLGRQTYIHFKSLVDIDYFSLGDYSQFAIKGSILQGHIEIGRHTYSGKIKISAKDSNVKIGSYCSFGNEISIFSGYTFHSPERVSTYPFKNIIFYNDKNLVDDQIDQKITSLFIGNDVWVGENVKILKSVDYIGHGSIIGAGSIVTKNVPDYAIVAGNPATFIRSRFNKKVIQSLLELKWWDWTDKKIYKNFSFFTQNISILPDIKELINKIG